MRYLLCALCLLPACAAYGQATKKVAGGLSGWSDNFRLSLANELTGDRPWLGELHLVAIYSRALTDKEVRQNYAAGSKPAPPVVEKANSTASSRIDLDLHALYTFDAGRGDVIQDRSGVGRPLDLRIVKSSGVQWRSGVLVVRSSTKISSSGPATKIIDAVKRSNAVTIEAWIKPANDRQSDLARIVSLSADTNQRNFTLGQDGKRYDVRLRTTATDENGKPSVYTSNVLSAALTHVVYTRDASGTARIYVNGKQEQWAMDITLGFMMPMSDGIRLRTNIFRPPGSKRLPVILMRTPYGSGGSRLAELWCPRGYNVVLQTCRGMFGSEGAFYMWQPEIQDGHDTLEWIARQPWCDGNIGMIGASHNGVTQWHAAFKGSRYLKAIVPVCCPSDFFNECQYRGGAFRLHLNLILGVSMWYRRRWDASSLPSVSVGTYMIPGLYNALPLIDADRSANYTWDFYRDWIHHPTRDKYWDTISNVNKFEQLKVPALIVGGYYDAYSSGSFVNFNGLRKSGASEAARSGTRVVVGAWRHGDCPYGVATKVGEMNFGPESVNNIPQMTDRFLDRWLKGEKTGIDQEPRVQVFVMGKNRWRYASEWPPAGTTFTNYYLHSRGKANTLHGDGELSTRMPSDEPADHYVYDPRDPVPSHGGFTLPSGGPTFRRGFYAEGPVDQRIIEKRPDVLVYSTDALEQDVEVTGPVTLKLFASSSARDTDFTGKLIDVYPDGRAINLCEGILRARYRKSQRKTELLQLGKVYEFTIDLMVTGNVFQKGHRIRLEVSSSNFPQFDRNPNTGNTFGLDAELQTAKQTVYHSRAYPSHLILPVNPNPIR